jgi:hypothetical protein
VADIVNVAAMAVRDAQELAGGNGTPAAVPAAGAKV